MTVLRIVKSATLCLAALALLAFASSDAQAQITLHGPRGAGIHAGFGGVGIHGAGVHTNHGWGGGHVGNIGHGGHGGHGWGVPAHTWHDTSHYDYHPGQFNRHGNHFHYQPGHYDWHQQGHVDHNHH